MPETTPGSGASALSSRTRHYAAYAAAFLVVYGGIRLPLGRFPASLLFGILIGSLLKDLYDEYRLRTGREPLAYAGFEHAPSNAVLAAFLLLGVISPAGMFASVPLARWALGLAVLDLAFDLWQDLRASGGSAG